MKKLVVALTVLVLLVVGCALNDSEKSPQNSGKRYTVDDLEYTILEISGMPCVWMQYGNDIDRGRAGYAGLSCDWSKWTGDGTIPTK